MDTGTFVIERNKELAAYNMKTPLTGTVALQLHVFVCFCFFLFFFVLLFVCYCSVFFFRFFFSFISFNQDQFTSGRVFEAS